MASSINPNNISVTFPIAGQDNDSQGFRDNFNNIKTNITYAKSEIEDLQNKVVLSKCHVNVVQMIDTPVYKNYQE